MQTFPTQPLTYAAANNKRAVVALAGGILFQAIFWQEKMALNTAFFFAFIVASLLMLYKATLHWKKSFWLLCTSFISLAAVVVHNSLLSKLALIISMLLLVAHTTNLYRSLHYGLAAVAERALKSMPQFAKDWGVLTRQKGNKPKKKYNFRILVLPLILAFLFTSIYLFASDVLADIASHIGDWVGVWLTNVFNWVSVPRLFFSLLGIFITSVFIINHKRSTANGEENEVNELTTKVVKANKNGALYRFQEFIFGKTRYSVLALQMEYKAAIISLVLLNLLLTMVNVTDIIYVWFNRTYKPGFEWAEFVHNGADILVFSILLAMAVLLYFFRGNINFLRQNKTLKMLAYIWLAQNFILTISVAIRNYYYIVHMGLAYKRIGLFVFVILVTAGLLTIYIKISQRKTAYYLLRTNGWIAFTLFILSTTVNWDEMIVRYNLLHKDEVPLDVPFLLSLNDKTIPILDQYRTYLQKPQTPLQRRYFPDYETGYYAGQLEWRKQEFKKEYNHHSWLSWNYTDSYVNNYLASKGE